MLNGIIKSSLDNRLLVVISSVLLIIGGTFVAFRMDVDVFPDLTAPTVVVLTEAHGMAPEEVETLVTFPIETSVNGATMFVVCEAPLLRAFRLSGWNSNGTPTSSEPVRSSMKK